ncbi:MAG: hypothetical protein IK104_05130 [Clostridia bacterium]|nr:hypothetical protein [Clostridia bacterium]
MAKKKKNNNTTPAPLGQTDAYLAPGLMNAVSPEFTPNIGTKHLGTPDANVEHFFDVLPELKGDRFSE